MASDTLRRVLAVLLLTAAFASAQSKGGKSPTKAAPKAAAKAPAAEDKWPIASIAVEGNHVYSAEQVIGLSGLKVGQVAGKPEFDAAAAKLTASGAFETAGYKFEPVKNGEGYAATLQITEAPAFYPLRFEDLHVPDADLEKQLAAKDPLFSVTKTPANAAVFARYTGWLEDYLKSRGQPEKVAARMMTVAPEEYVIVFRPEKEPPSVAQVTFEGNHVLSQLILRDAVASATVGLVYREADFRKALQASVVPVYEARGRMHVTFPKIRTELASDVKGLHVFVTVDEGDVFTLGKIDVNAPAPFDPAKLLHTADLKGGDVANFDRVTEALDRVRKSVRHDGYLDAAVTQDRKEDEAKKIVDLTIRLEPGPLYTMGKLTITGLELEGESAIKRLWTLAPGKPFNPDYPDAFLKTVKEERMFDHLGDAKAATVIDRAAHTVSVTLTFAGPPDPLGPKKNLPAQ